MGTLRKIGRKIDDAIIKPVVNTVKAIVDDPKKLVGVALAVAFPGAGAALGAQLGLTGVAAKVVGQALINTAVNGGDVKSAVIGAALPLVGDVGANAIGETLTNSNITGTLNTVVTKAVTQGTTAALLGKDPLAAFVLGGASAGVSLITQDIPGFNELPEAAKNAVNTAVVAQISKGDVGSAVTTSLINDAISYATKAIDDYKKNPEGITNRVVDEAIPQGDVSFNAPTPDAEFLAADATQLAGQGIGQAQIKDVLSPYTSDQAAELASSMAINNVPLDTAASQLTMLSENVGLTNAGVSESEFLSADVKQLQEQGIGTDQIKDITGVYASSKDIDTALTPPETKSSFDPKEALKLAMRMMGAVTAGAVVSEAASSTTKRPINLEYGDIYKDAPIKGFAMRKGEDGRYTPFIGEKAQLAKGGLASRRN